MSNSGDYLYHPPVKWTVKIRIGSDQEIQFLPDYDDPFLYSLDLYGSNFKEKFDFHHLWSNVWIKHG